MKNAKKVVLAYSGGVDTSACIPFLINEYGVEEDLISRMEEREKMNADMLRQMAELAAQQDA